MGANVVVCVAVGVNAFVCVNGLHLLFVMSCATTSLQTLM